MEGGMADITSLLPAWLLSAAVPAVAVMGFFGRVMTRPGPEKLVNQKNYWSE